MSKPPKSAQCSACGAPLEVLKGSAFSRCSYCGHSNKVKSAATLIAEHPNAWVPPPTAADALPPPAPPPPVAPAPFRMPKWPFILPFVITAFSFGMQFLATRDAEELTQAAIEESRQRVEEMRHRADGLDSERRPPSGQLLQPNAQPALGVLNLDLHEHEREFVGQLRTDVIAANVKPGCEGHIGRAPDLLVVTTVERALTISATGSNDLTLLTLDADGGYICDDDSGEGTDPRLDVSWRAGTHYVWVGEWAGAPGTFTLRIEE